MKEEEKDLMKAFCKIYVPLKTLQMCVLIEEKYEMTSVGV